MNGTNNNTTSGFDLNHPTIVALLYLASFFIGITSLVGIVLAYVWRGEAAGSWEASHYTFHIRTFWIAVIAGLISAVLSLILIGLFGLLAVAVWVVIRTVIALLAAQRREPIANPESWLW
ncbi:Uncharacterized membrane protein [Sphingomonas laterariae]|uniref:Uncharacterized membrane protein n=1 Tax=Edaphosphingomonas laterariae TaxID=861865 RepID=A0A239G172_9SPHN|nr:hypothetical protein [Sphingomonas laterariae]SNS62909.1 Uncharacterized membrane protein [Sphingomonas laterariae]